MRAHQKTVLNTTYGSTVIFNCNPGYGLPDSLHDVEFACLETGSWSPDGIRCGSDSPKIFSHYYSLLDKVGYTVIGDSQRDQHLLMLKEFHMRRYVVTKRRCVWNKIFLLGHLVWNKVISFFISLFFIMFLYT